MTVLSTLRVCAMSTVPREGHRKPRGKIPEGCYWDPRPGEAAGAWRRIDSNAIYDPKAREMNRKAAHRHAETTSAGRRARAAPPSHARDEPDNRAEIEQRVETDARDGSLHHARDETDAHDGSPYARTPALDSLDGQGMVVPPTGCVLRCA